MLRRTALAVQAVSLALSLLVPRAHAVGNSTACSALNTADFSSLNTTILNATYYDSASTVDALGTCQTTASLNVSLCRVEFVVNTSSISAITAEAWLPDDWNERLLALGNGGLDGCIDYSNLDYGTALGFAAVGSNNGHDGMSGEAFENNTEVLADFTSRAVHVETLVGKQIVQTYYGQAQNHSYYLGCSTGGRQGFYAALHFPDDFDGILAGSPATNFNHLISWSAVLSRFIGAPGNTSASFISSDLWEVASKEVFRQCDGLDGVIDGVITEPDFCDFRPEQLLCDSAETSTNSSDSCLTLAQVDALKRIYSPLYGNNDTLLYPRFEPGAENNSASSQIFDGTPFQIADDWMKYVVDTNTTFDYSTFWLPDIEKMDALNPGNISTLSGDLFAFRERGGKLISYHGRADPLISALNSKRVYDLTARTIGEPILDDFYRLFLIPGMGHCGGGVGPVEFGQGDNSTAQTIGQESNILLDLVNWVENGTAPDTVTGVNSDGTMFRKHCRYPMRSVWNGTEWTCVGINDVIL